MKNILFLIVFFCINILNSQNQNENLKFDLEKMRIFFLNKQFDLYSDFIYPETIRIYGGIENLKNNLASELEKMKKDGYFILNIYFDEFSEPIYKNNEIQISLTQTLLLQTPNGKIEGKYSLIAISNDTGLNWKFIDSSGKTKEQICEIYTNLDDAILIKEKDTVKIDESKLQKKCKKFNNLKMFDYSPITNNKSTIYISNNTSKELLSDGEIIVSEIKRDNKNQCEMDLKIIEISNDDDSLLKKGDTMHLIITKYDKNKIHYLAKWNNFIIPGEYVEITEFKY